MASLLVHTQGSWYLEKRSAYIYKKLAKIDKQHSKLFEKLANEAEDQAKIWEKKLIQCGGKIKKFRPDLRTKIVLNLIKKFGVKPMRGILAAMKVRGLSVYLKTHPGHPMPKSVADIGHRHKNIGTGNNMRAAVFGVNDGLVSNASLIMGMAGAQSSHNIIILAGIAGLLAGAFSMGAGEYVSVRSQREMFEHQIDLEKKELELYPEEEAAELALIYQARGLGKTESQRVAKLLMKDPDNALDILAREELGINPDDLVSPMGAAISSFVSFTIGAAIPVIPFLFQMNSHTIYFTIVISALSLFIVGAVLSLYTGRNAFLSGFRMLVIGFFAGAITFLIGRLLGGIQLG